MAIFNAALKSGCGPTGVYSAFCESKDDLNEPAAEAWGEGSTVVCLNTDAGRVPTVHVKLPDGSWNEVANNG